MCSRAWSSSCENVPQMLDLFPYEGGALIVLGVRGVNPLDYAICCVVCGFREDRGNGELLNDAIGLNVSWVSQLIPISIAFVAARIFRR